MKATHPHMYEAQENHFRNALLLLFIWFVSSLFCGITAVEESGVSRIGLFVSGALVSLTTVAAVMLLATSRRDLQLLLFVAHVVLSFLPVWAFAQMRGGRVGSLFDLFYVILVITPVFYRVWGWKFQSITGFVSLIGVGLLWLPSGIATALRPLFVVTSASVLSVLASYVRETHSTPRVAPPQRADAVDLAAQISRRRFPAQVFGALMLQVYLFGVLVFLDYALQQREPHPFLVSHLNAFLIVVFGGLLLKIVKSAYLAPSMAGISIVVLLILATSSIGQSDRLLLNVTIPMLLVCFSTVALPWSIGFSITIAWIMLLGAIAALCLSIGSAGARMTDSVGLVFVHYRSDLALLILGATGSVIAAQLLRQRWFSGVSLAIERELAEPLSSVGLERCVLTSSFESLPRPSSRDLERRREKQLLAGMFGLGVYSNAVTTAMAFSSSGSSVPFLLVPIGWVLFAMLWGALYYALQIGVSHQRVFQFGALSVLILMLAPGAGFVTLEGPAPLWFLWPVSFLIGLGAIPWNLEEITQLGVIVSLAAVEIVAYLQLGVGGAMVFGVTIPLGLLLATFGLRRLKERALLGGFNRVLEGTSDTREASRVLADAFITLLDADCAIFSVSDEHLELVRGGKSYPIDSRDWPLRKLREQLIPLDFDECGVGLRVASWLPNEWSFFDRRFGVFSYAHGLLVEMNLSQRARTGYEVEKAEEALPPTAPILLFVASRYPLFPLFKGGEFAQCRLLAGMCMLRLETCAERTRSSLRQRQFELAQAEREYELSALVHDINNTVQDLSLLCDTMLETLGEEEEGQTAVTTRGKEFISHLKRVNVIARSMATVVSDAKRKRELERLSDLSPRELVEVTGVLGEIVAFATVRAERKRITVREERVGEEPLWIKISAREHLETILRNLLNNAITYSDPGSTVVVKLRADAEFVAIDIADNGPGLSAEECKAIFHPGYRGSSAVGTPGGLGIGLSESKRVAEAAGGSLEVYSAGARQGSTFTVRLPRQPAPNLVASKIAWALMVDDQPNLTEFYGRVARALHFTPVLAGSVNEAVSHLEQRGKPSFVLTDLHLGTGDGLELIRYIREQFGNHLPILVVSGHNDQDIEERVRRAGATDFVAKPISRQALFARIQSILPSN